MADTLPEDMREAIARFQGEPTVCPPGAVSVLEFSASPWGKRARGTGEIILRTGETPPSSPPGRELTRAERRQKVRELAADGRLTRRQIADRIGAPFNLVADDVRALGLTVAADKASPRAKRQSGRQAGGGRLPRTRLQALVDEGLTPKQIAERADVSPQYVYTRLSQHKIKAAREPRAYEKPREDTQPAPEPPVEPEAPPAKVEPPAPQIAAPEPAAAPEGPYPFAEATCGECGRPISKRGKTGLCSRCSRPSRDGAPQSVETVTEKRERRADAARERLKDRRRFKATPVPDGSVRAPLPGDHPAVVEGRPLFENRIMDPADPGTCHETILKDGRWNSKIGGDVLVGDIEGAQIVTLSLAERITCPRSCAHWRTCYGNNDQHARRWLPGAALEDRLEREVADLANERPTLVRLHYLGDFYSLHYARFWADMLIDHPGLSAFGFTAHAPESDIGRHIAKIRKAFGARFAIRHSNRTGAWGSFTIDFPTERKRLGDAVVCPEQRDAMTDGSKRKHCGNCALCWQSDVPIVFVEH